LGAPAFEGTFAEVRDYFWGFVRVRRKQDGEWIWLDRTGTERLPWWVRGGRLLRRTSVPLLLAVAGIVAFIVTRAAGPGEEAEKASGPEPISYERCREGAMDVCERRCIEEDETVSCSRWAE